MPEFKGDASAQLIDHLEKPAMTRETDRLLAGTGWLLEPLRLTDVAVETASGRDAGDEDAELPYFLTSNDNALCQLAQQPST